MMGLGLSMAVRRGAGSGAAAFVPLAGSAIDINIATGQSFGGTVGNCFNGGQTAIIGALLTLMIAPQGSLVLQLKANPVVASSWITDDGGGVYFGKIGTTQFRAITLPDSVPLTATLGGATTYASPSKLAVSWGVTGTSVVANNGTTVTNASILEDGSATAITVNSFADFDRITGWTSKIADATLKGFTV